MGFIIIRAALVLAAAFPVYLLLRSSWVIQPLHKELFASDDPMWFEEEFIRRQSKKRSASLTGRRLSRTPYNWLQVTDEAGFCPRYAHSSVINREQEIFVIGGAKADVTGFRGGTQHGYLNDVWLTSDQGQSWNKVTPRSSRFSPRRGHATTTDSRGVVIFLLGGFCGKACFMNDWWSSETGDIWISLGDAKWSPRHGHAAVMTSKDVLVMFGGHDGFRYLDDVWYIQDPSQAMVYSSWRQAAAHAPWKARYGHAVVINSVDSIFLTGGFHADKQSGTITCFNDVWKSEDNGVSWILIVEHAPWSGRYQHAAQINLLDEIFVLGGLSMDLERCGDVWRSADSGQTWAIVTPEAPWAARYEHTVVSDQNSSLYIIGGMSTGEEKFNDVWRSERTCADDMRCPGDSMICRDGTDDNFEGLPSPVCSNICDRRIFDECKDKEKCHAVHGQAVCVDPCDHQECSEGEVCEVEPRTEQRIEANAYCLACGKAQTKFRCDKLRQCRWDGGDEVCKMRCSVMTSQEKCTADEDLSCKWSKEACVTKG